MKNYSKVFAVLLAIAMILPGFAQLAVADKGTPEVVRITGKTRVETSINVSKEAYKKADTAILAGYDGEADALTGTLLAEDKDAPILLTYKDKLDPALLAELKRLEAKTIYILGGTKAVNESVVTALEAESFEVKRLTGSTRIETAVNIAKEVFDEDKPAEAFFVEYNALSDALAIGPVAAEKEAPIFLTHHDRVPEETKQAIEDMGIKKGTIVGGEKALPETGEEALKALVPTLERVKGSSRSQTALAIAKKYFEKPKAVIVANGWTLADALVGGYFGELKDAPVLLSQTDKIDKDVLDYIKETNVNVYILGGTSAIGTLVLEKIQDLFKKDGPVDPQPELQDVVFELLPEDATVVVKSNGQVVSPASNGNYKLKSGNYTYEVSREGYESKSGEFEVKNETVLLKVTLEKADTSDIEKALERLYKKLQEVGKYVQAEYTEDSYAKLTEAHDDGMAVYESENSTLAQIEKAIKDIDEAIAALVKKEAPKVDKSALEALLRSLGQIFADEDKYTEDSYAALVEAYDAGNAVMGNKDASQDQVDKAVRDLEEARDNLVLVEGAAEKAVEEFEKKVDSAEKVVALVTDRDEREAVSKLFTPAFNLVQHVKDKDKREGLLERLNAANDKLIAASFVNGLQKATENLTEDSLFQAKIKLTSAKGNVGSLPDGDIKDALMELILVEENKIKKFEEDQKVDQQAVKRVENMIEKLPEAEVVTIDHANQVGKARDAFYNLTIAEQELVKNKDKLMEVLEALEELEIGMIEELATMLVEEAEASKDPEDIALAQSVVDELPEGEVKALLQARLDAIVAVGGSDTGSNSEDRFLAATASLNLV